MSPTIPAELVIKNVSVVTMNPQQPFAVGVAIAEGEVIGLLLNKSDQWPLATDGKYLDGHGLTILPGLIDAHCHLRAQISSQLSISCDKENATSIDDIIHLIHGHQSYVHDGKWIRASGYDPFYLKEQRHPTRWDLDKASTSKPIRLRHVTRHASVLNSVALCLAGIGPGSIDPSGVHVERNPETDEPTGLIYGGDSWLSKHVIPPLSHKDLQYGTHQLQRFLLSKGVTAVQDATPTNTHLDLEYWASQIRSNWPLTTQLMSSSENHKNMTTMLQSEYYSDVRNALQMGPVKVVMEANPEIYPTTEELNEIALEATERDFTIAVHVVNPEMLTSAINSMDYANRHLKQNKRHRLEHLSLCPDVFLSEISKRDLIVVTNPNLIYNHGDRYLVDVEMSEQDWLYKMKSVKNNGISLAAGSDAPIASFDPWTGMQTSCTRLTSSDLPVNLEEKLNRWESLEMFTTGAALAGGWENCLGRISPGYQADLIAVDQNPLVCPLKKMSQTRVYATWIKGEIVYQDCQ